MSLELKTVKGATISQRIPIPEYRQQYIEIVGVEPPSTAEVIGKFLASKRAANLREASIRSYQDTLKPFAKHFSTLPSSPGDIESYLERHRGETSTAWNYYIVIRLLYSFAEGRGLLPFPNPFDQVPAPKKVTCAPQHLTLTQLGVLYRACEDDRERAFVVCLFGMGIRLKGTRHLTPDDIGEGTLMVEPKRGKRAKEPVLLQPEFRQVVLKQAEGQKRFVFPGRKGQPISDTMVQLIVKRLFQRAGIQGVRASPHTGRHTRGVLQGILGADTYSGRRLLGHSTTQMTDVYSELNLDELRQKDRQVNPLLRILHSEAELGKNPD